MFFHHAPVARLACCRRVPSRLGSCYANGTRISPLPRQGCPILTKQLYPYFCRGLLTGLPLGLTVNLLSLSQLERIAGSPAHPPVHRRIFDLPGLDLALGITGIFLLGVLMSQRWVGKRIGLVELPFSKLPEVKRIHSSLKASPTIFSPQLRAQRVFAWMSPPSVNQTTLHS